MELTPEIITTAAVGVVVFVGAIGNYLRTLKERPARGVNAVVAGIAMGYGDKEQTERVIAVMVRCAVALEILADRRTDEMEDMHKSLLERLDAQRREEQEDQVPRRHPPRRPPRR